MRPSLLILFASFAGNMSNQGGEDSTNLVESIADIARQLAEMNGKLGGMEERLIRVEGVSNGGSPQATGSDKGKRSMEQSLTNTPGQAHNMCHLPLTRSQNFQQQPTFLNHNPPKHPRPATPHPNPQSYHQPQESRSFVKNQNQNQAPPRNASMVSLHGSYMSPPRNIPQTTYQDYRYQNPLTDDWNDEVNRKSFGSMEVGMGTEYQGMEDNLKALVETKACEDKSMGIEAKGFWI